MGRHRTLMITTVLPKGFRAIAIGPSVEAICWPICLVVDATVPEDAKPIRLHHLPDCRAFLGCVCDGEGRVREWLQIWVQNLEDLSSVDVESPTGLSSLWFDDRWAHFWQATRKAAPDSVVLEIPIAQAVPLHFDPRSGEMIRPRLPGGGYWKLCRDDSTLAAAGLPLYSQSWQRFLIADAPPGEPSRFVSADRAAKDAENSPASLSRLGFDERWTAVNPQGTSMVARVHALLDVGDYADLLSGLTIVELADRKNPCEIAALQSALVPNGSGGRRHGWLLGGNNPTEVLHLKLRLFHQATAALMLHLRELQSPLLNLDPSSFGVFVHPRGDLPWTWTTSCSLVRPGQALPLRIPGTDEARFVAVGRPGAAVYCPTGLSKRCELSATLRPLRVTVHDASVAVEGTLQCRDPVPVDTSDILRFRLPQGEISGDFYGAVVIAGPGRLSEIKFRTWPRHVEPRQLDQLRRLEGGRMERCWCEFIPAVSSPYDLYSLAALGARVLLCHPQNPLSSVMDSLERLGRSVGQELPPRATSTQIASAVEHHLAHDLDAGPLALNHLLGNVPDKPSNSDWLPTSLWSETLAMLLRLIPGLGPASLCSDYGAAPTDAIHLPLEEPLATLESLTALSRSLVFSDWNFNREIRQVLAELQAEG